MIIMFVLKKKNNKKNQKISDIEKKIKLYGKINLSEFEFLLELNWEITFEYNGEVYEIIQNSCIELYCNCFYEDGKTKFLSYTKFFNPKDFIKNATIQNKKFSLIINDINILHC